MNDLSLAAILPCHTHTFPDIIHIISSWLGFVTALTEVQCSISLRLNQTLQCPRQGKTNKNHILVSVVNLEHFNSMMSGRLWDTLVLVRSRTLDLCASVRSGRASSALTKTLLCHKQIRLKFLKFLKFYFYFPILSDYECNINNFISLAFGKY